MGALIRAYDWAGTSIGEPATWPQSLRTSISIMLNTNHPVFIWWGDDLIQFYNDAYSISLGPERHPSALGQRGRECWEEIWDVIGPQIDQVMRTGEPTWHEDQLVPVTRFGRRDAVYWTYGYSRITDEDGPGGVLVLCREVTREHISALALREREAELARVQQIGRIGGLEVDLRHGFQSRRSPEYLLVHGLPPDAVHDSHEDWLRRLHPDDRVNAERQFIEAVHGDGSEYFAKYRIIRPDNGQVRWIAVKSVIERDAAGVAVRLVGAHIDITDQVLVEQALLKSEEEALKLAVRLSELNDTLEQRVRDKTRERDRIWNVSRDLLLVARQDGVLRSVNPAWTMILGWRELELLERTSEWLEHPDDRARFRTEISKLESGSAVVRFEGRLRHKDGSYRWLSWTAVPDQDLIYAVARDITADKVAVERLNAAEEALRHSQKMEAVGQLTGGIAHDFNNILTGIVGSLDLLQAKISRGDVSDAARYINAAMTSANRAAALTHRLLAFARRQPLIPKAVDANALVDSLEDLLRRTIGQTLVLVVGAARDLWLTLCDPNQLESALLNLAINARDAMPDGGRLSITTTNERIEASGVQPQALAPGHYVCIAVSDTGVGMSPEVMARAADPFFTTKPIGQGTGLGLSMIYGFARQSNGHLAMESEVGVGTTVRLYLPRYLGEAELEAPPQEQGDGALARGEHVLVVEDEPVVRSVLIEKLAEYGYRVFEANDAPSGLRILQQQTRIDLLVTDVGLPGMNGRQLADQAREIWPGLKVLFMTGYAEGAALSQDFLEPGMEMVTKPFDLQHVTQRIRDMILK